MKRIISSFMILFILFAVSFSAFSFSIDGIDSGVEWDGAAFYKLIDGESNCGVDFGLVKVKFDYDNNAVCLCFYFTDPELTSDNKSAGIFIEIDNSASFEIIAFDGSRSENHTPYSFDGAVLVDEINGATCEIRVGIKSGLPESIDFDTRFIDSHGYYSDYYHFTVINELYETTVPDIIQPTADNTDPFYNPNTSTSSAEKTTRERKTKAPTTKKSTTRKSTSKKTTVPFNPDSYYFDDETDSYWYTRRKSDATKKSESSTKKTIKTVKSEKAKEKIYYYEKEVYISEVYVTQSGFSSPAVLVSNDFGSVTESDSFSETSASSQIVSLSKGTKYKKIFAVICLVIFLTIAFFGTYSAKKSKNQPDNKE